MRLVVVVDGAPELRWTWLPYWLAQSPALKRDVERLIQDAVVLNSVELTEEGLDRLSEFACKVLCRRFKIPALHTLLSAMAEAQEA